MLKDSKDSPQTKSKHRNTPAKRSSSYSSSPKSKRSSSLEGHPKKSRDQQDSSGKLFFSKLDSNQSVDALQEQIRQLLGKKYEVQRVQVKKSHNGYSFAFVDVKENDKVEEIIAEFNNYKLNGKRILIERKRMVGEKAMKKGNCYNCGKEGHFARDCIAKRSTTEQKYKISDRKRKREGSSESIQRERIKSIIRRYRSRDKKRDKKKKNSQDSSSNQSSSSQQVSSSSSSSSENRKRKAKKRERRHKNKKKHAKRKGKGKSKAKKASSSDSQ